MRIRQQVANRIGESKTLVKCERYPGRRGLQEGRDIASDLMEKLGIRESDLVSCAYADLMLTGDK